jgi:hypothetical protein
MDQKQKVPTRELVAKVKRDFPCGTQMRRISDGKQYIMGNVAARGNFWMMAISPPEKGLVPAETVVRLMERVGGAVAEKPRLIEFKVG